MCTIVQLEHIDIESAKHVTSHVHCIDSEIQTWRMCYKYSSFGINIMDSYDEKET